MRIEELCTRREIPGVSRSTPLLVPSFSTRGVRDVAAVYEANAERVSDALLVSSYDLYHKHLSSLKMYESEVLFLDSGGYETGKTKSSSDPLNLEYKAKDWSRAAFLEVIDQVNPDLSDVVVISFDTFGDITEQFKHGVEPLLDRSGVSVEFLVKPTAEDSILALEDITANIELFGNVDLIGLTEEELARSIRDRCSRIIELRRTLSDVGLDLPIHILGCFDPAKVLLYTACGADVFDGLSWLRYAWIDGSVRYLESAPIVNGYWKDPVDEARAKQLYRNLEAIEELQEDIEEFAVNHEIDEVPAVSPRFRNRIPGMLDEIGVEMETIS